MYQMEFYESITKDERNEVKLLLKRYPKLSRIVTELRSRPELTPKQQERLNDWGLLVDEIDVAFGLIIDDEVQLIFEHRYMKGLKYSSTIDRFWDKHRRSEKTIDRRIGRGVDTIAEHLKLCGIVGKSDGRLTVM